MPKKRTISQTDMAFNESLISNDFTYLHFYEQLFNLAIGMIEWKNMPIEIDTRYLEKSLATHGRALFFYDEIMEQYLTLNFTTAGPLSVYETPIWRNAYANNGYRRKLSGEDSVIIYNNYMRTNDISKLMAYAARITEVQRAIDVNVKGQKTPKIIRCSPQQRLTMEQLYMKYDGNQPFIFADKSLDVDAMKTIDTTAPYVAGNLNELKNQIWNEALTFLGISNNSNEKRERLTLVEVSSNLGTVAAQRESRLNARKNACELINHKYGLNISVDYRESLELPEPLPTEDKEKDEEEKEVKDDE